MTKITLPPGQDVFTECTEESPCEKEGCEDCDAVLRDDCICRACGEHSVLRQSGTECCGFPARW